jgi:crotonobetainyl-CoA:carnitine CoA-transferase CaiB-like acyl-CoA transferase
MTDALDQLRVLDLTTTIAGPHCTRLLADLGAEVIKVEAPGGDIMRRAPPVRNGASSSFGQLNAGKKGVVLDFKAGAGIDILRRLVRSADVLVENYRPGVMRRLGLDYETLRLLKPDLIYCAVSGYGQTGPSSELPAYAPAIHAASGYDVAHLDYQDGRERPDNCGIYVADVLAGTYAFGAITTALLVRERTGAGQMIDVSMLESMLALLLPEVQKAQFDIPPARPLYSPIATRDGYIMPAMGTERTFHGLAKATGREDWITDPRFALFDDRRKHWGALMDELEVWAKQRDTEECRAAFDANGVPCSPYRSVEQAMADPQIAHRGALAEVQDAGGSFKVINPPFRMSASRTAAGERAPALGEHTRAVLLNAGYSAPEIAGFIAEGSAAGP